MPFPFLIAVGIGAFQIALWVLSASPELVGACRLGAHWVLWEEVHTCEPLLPAQRGPEACSPEAALGTPPLLAGLITLGSLLQPPRLIQAQLQPGLPPTLYCLLFIIIFRLFILEKEDSSHLC